MAGVLGKVEMGGLEDGFEEDGVTGLNVVDTPVVGLIPAVVSALVSFEDLQADASEMDEMAAPAARMPALFRTCRLVNCVTRRLPLFF